MDANSHDSPTYDQIINDTKNGYLKNTKNHNFIKKNYDEWYNICLIETIKQLDIFDSDNNIDISLTAWSMMKNNTINILENKTNEFINLKDNELSIKLKKKLKFFTKCMC